jgi:hypothetical protein
MGGAQNSALYCRSGFVTGSTKVRIVSPGGRSTIGTAKTTKIVPATTAKSFALANSGTRTDPQNNLLSKAGLGYRRFSRSGTIPVVE